MTGDRKNQGQPAVSPAIEALLNHERVLPAQPEPVRARMMARAQAALYAPSAATPAPRAAPTQVRWRLLAAAAGITLVAGMAAAFQMMRRPAPAPSTRVESPQPAPPQIVSPTSATPEPAVAEQQDAPSAVLSHAWSPSRPKFRAAHDGGLEELQLLNRAREFDGRGDYTNVLSVLAEHERRHPTGRLSEEREVLRVKALVGLGRSGDARRTAANFHHQFPHSVLLRTIDELVAPTP